ncbi:hypothetical protein LCGC14_0225970 [marine sediment metagenome]|uniref:Uncharacterized protein n=1 Tax=marine sediment metagenome TaxID=412755 RepID=A0A0F9UG54_9ZZZZ|nr:hypothetical protein [Phycisphaerae bacterium]HDZ42950.1 hypothetical protein [Phycisphaerae bacterium]
MPKSKLSGFSLDQLKAEISRRIVEIDRLIKQRNELERLLSEINGLTGRPGRKVGRKKKPGRKPGKKAGRKPGKKASKKAVKKAGKRGPRKGGASLGDIMAKVLAGKAGVKVAAVVKMVLAAGYKTKSANFGGQVSQCLRLDKRFRKVRRGVFALKKS